MTLETLIAWLQEIEKSPKSMQTAQRRAAAIVAAQNGITQKDIDEYRQSKCPAHPHKNFKTFAEHSIPQKEKEGDENE